MIWLQQFQESLKRGSVELLLSRFVAQVERKVDALRAVVQGKEAEISELRARLNRALLSAPNRPETEADRERPNGHQPLERFPILLQG